MHDADGLHKSTTIISIINMMSCKFRFLLIDRRFAFARAEVKVFPLAANKMARQRAFGKQKLLASFIIINNIYNRPA